MTKQVQPQNNKFLLYTTPSGEVRVEVLFENETIWLTQKKMAELFNCTTENVIIHLKNIYSDGELLETSTTKDFLVIQKEGGRSVNRNVKIYNLDAIIAVGYRVNSSKATQFRIWATQVLKEYIIKGFALNDEGLKNGTFFGVDYFKELLERVRSIRASERRIYQQITDIFAECSIDYNRSSETAKEFFGTVQNKFHFAIAGKTAAEIVYKNADSKKPFMGLKTWKKSTNGRILKSDVAVAKNYLDEVDIKKLERTVSGYFDYIERMIEAHTTFTMKNLAESINEFLQFNKYEILQGKGNVSHAKAEKKAFGEYDTFNKTQNIESDFDKEIKKYLKEQ